MPYTTTADLPASVRDIIETATGRLLFLGVLKRAGAEGTSDVVAFSQAWAGLSRAGYVEHPDGMWRRLPPAQRADTAALTRAVKAAARIEAMGRGYFKACKDCSGSTAPTCKAQGRCLAVAAKAYNPAQPRANDGKWTVGGFGAGILAPQFGGSPDTFMAKEPPVATALADNANPDDIAVFTRHVGRPVTRALIDFQQENYTAAARELRRVRNGAARFGGSHAQRDLLDLTAPESLSKREGPAGELNLAYRHAQASTIYGGTSEVLRSQIAERNLGLPRTRA